MCSHLSEQLLQSMIEERSRARSSYREMRVHYWADFPRIFGWNWWEIALDYIWLHLCRWTSCVSSVGLVMAT